MDKRCMWLGMMCAMLIVAAGCFGGPPKTSLPPEDDALLSYLLAAHSLAQFLNMDVPPRPTDNPEQLFADACAKIESLQAAAAARSPSEIARLCANQDYADTVKTAQDSWKVLAAKQAKDGKVAKDKWARIERVFEVCRKLEVPESALSENR